MMQLQRFVDALKADLSAVAELGNEETAEVAGRLVLTLQASVGLRLLDALSEAALELTDRLPSGHVEVRLAGQDPELVFVGDAPDDALGFTSSERRREGFRGALSRVIGFDDIEMAAPMGLTTVRQPLYETGARGAPLLLAALAGGTEPVEELKELSVVERRTT